ncbi:MAG: NUDIX hydrolase [bacterium]
MLEEQVDIVNVDNVVVSSTGKSVAHLAGDLHRIVIAELKNSKGEYCFVKQAGDRQDPWQFVSPIGGHVSAGESIEHAMIRECEEEVGFTPTSYRFVGSTIYNRAVIGRNENHFFHVFEIDCDHDPVLNHESVEFRWFSVAEIKELLRTSPATFGAAWHHVYKNILPDIYAH